ncbi:MULTISPECIES: UDP-N-acetylmuramoyl-tripeptide--D-alanyl-D-alanine ligase [unclassified Arcicella]|uniref:UDP-N-acetylmuramoyl-tripeptide--D-alanyl-D- alanine ligase n=1 Tax=unclassified Arcicella TaxID=2644986 RepID=UPI002857C8D9|nr:MULTISPECIES: UDP-N-acetylmuramoyl-tripeptide--D-alanyl-D-alanine ligase [unclassified Arcicella]MDR6563269.1 UDP-N-acetylmuramoyl-tripeptide--D-alanyl-D-alanine ligase [Arcicella sp. BE51]MDR6811580.1 UDP-N-acetylmuramoyl-tripeptide--D-alanyl-D-alanine ligase [Arcicella sp. BE140]MDR6823106.1 UDP-N-acetylmuramoyl-tripeptide--D-alanyl-D-alanine ligase [Arcicella sp. BE139]
MISLTELYQKYKECSSVSTDTRKIGEGSMFFALKGPNFNANAFAEQALAKGAKYAVVDDAFYVKNEQYLLVEDGLKALQQLANFHRKQLAIPFIGLTGSNGKTTTKELINCVLSKKYCTYATLGNLNNHIGVPLTILAIDETIEIAIIEMGANKQGDIKELVEIAEPTHGFITNIGKAHLEGFGGMEGVKKGKGELYDWLSANNGTVFVNVASEPTYDMIQRYNFKETIVYTSNKNPTFENVVNILEESPFVVFEDLSGNIYTSHLTGIYNFQNICAAIRIGQFFNIETSIACQAVADYVPNNNRSQFIQKGTNMVLMDAYNANPSSMSAAITYFNDLKVGKKMVILGDMFELGEEAIAEHEAIGKLLLACNFDYILLAGHLMENAVRVLPIMKVHYFPDKFGLHNWLQDYPVSDTHILVKGSRGMGLESVLQFLG